MQAKVVFPHPFPKTFYMGAVFNGVFFAFLKNGVEGTGRAPTNKRTPKCGGWCMGSCRGIANAGDRATEKVSICACLLCAFPALRFVKCSLTVRQVQFRSPLAKIITTSKRKCARSCGAGDVAQGGGRCPKQYLSVLRGCISAHCANIQPHNLAFSVARSPTADASRRFAH